MRIIQLISQTVLGGAESFGFTLSAELARRGHEVLLLANRANGPLFERERPAGMNTRALPRTSRLDPRILLFLVGSILRFRPDVVHSHNFGANTWARCLGILFPKLIVVCHDHSGRKPRQRTSLMWLDRILYRRCATVFAVSAELGDLLRRRHRVPAHVLQVLPNGIDVEGYAPPTPDPEQPSVVGASAESPVAGPSADSSPSGAAGPLSAAKPPDRIVCVASLTPVKNHALLLDAFARVRKTRPQAKLTLVGDGPLRAELEGQATRLEVSDAITFAGLQHDVRPFLWDASVFVLASAREAMPLALLEAMAAGLACVATDVGEIPEILEGGCGVIVPVGDATALAGAILSLLDDDDARRSVARAGRARVESAYSLGACVDRVEEAYRAAQRR